MKTEQAIFGTSGDTYNGASLSRINLLEETHIRLLRLNAGLLRHGQELRRRDADGRFLAVKPEVEVDDVATQPAVVPEPGAEKNSSV